MIPIFDLAAQQAVMKRQIDENISRTLAHGKYILGPEVDELEERLCEYTGAKFCITCANGTDALQIALMAIGVGPGDEVITTGFSYIAAAEAITLLGAKPIYVDIDLETYNLDALLIEQCISDKTKAIIPVSLYGQPANFTIINEVARKYDLVVIEDAAQSFGAEYSGDKSCNLSDIACTSFFPTKSLGCYGDGGAIFTSNKEHAYNIRRIARHGQEGRYNHTVIGVNSRLDTVQAAILLVKLDVLDDEIKRRNTISNYYCEHLEQLSNITTPVISPRSKSAWGLFTIRSGDRDALHEFLTKKDIQAVVHYPMALPQQVALRDLDAAVPMSVTASHQVLSIPCHAYMGHRDIELVVDAIQQFDTLTSSASSTN